MEKRSNKFYYKNEKDVANKLGLKPIPGSGSGWVHKEDMENENLLVQLKSTDSSSYRIQLLDLKKLEYHANISNKQPIFLLQFLQDNRLYAIVDIDLLEQILPTEKSQDLGIRIADEIIEVEKIKSTKSARETFFKEKEEKYRNGK